MTHYIINNTDAPDSIIVRWYEDGQRREYVLIGNKADDLLEHYRAAPDEETRQLVLAHAVRRP